MNWEWEQIRDYEKDRIWLSGIASCSVNSCKRTPETVTLSDIEITQVAKLEPTKDTIYIDSMGHIWNVKVDSGALEFSLTH